ncbi:potassium channel subfamily K member 17-like, partial [Saccoglossus kowalevskii]
MHCITMVILCVVFIVYLVIGAVIFMLLESDNEDDTRSSIRHLKIDWLDNYTCVDNEALEKLIMTAVYAYKSGVSPFNNSTNPSNWDFSSSFFFAGTVVTTIGYGKHVPTTYWGRNAVIPYALIGIPFTGWILSKIGEHWQGSFRKQCKVISGLLPSKTPRMLRRCVQTLTVGFATWIVFVVIPAVIYTYMENWDFYIAHYYSFITLTTIGFGDYVATQDPSLSDYRWVYDIGVALWYLFGLSYLAVVITAIHNEQKEKWKQVKLVSMKLTKKVHHPNNTQVIPLKRSLSLETGLSLNSLKYPLQLHDLKPSHPPLVTSFIKKKSIDKYKEQSYPSFCYGNISPETRSGQSFCIVFASIGIPLCLVILAEIGVKLGKPARKLEDRVKKFNWAREHPKIARHLYLIFLISIGLICFVTIPSIIISAVEDWDMHTSWYYCFITLFTIGFGDYVI